MINIYTGIEGLKFWKEFEKQAKELNKQNVNKKESKIKLIK